MENQKALFEMFMHNNMPQEPLDPDQILTKAHMAAPSDYQPSPKFTNDMNRLIKKSKRMATRTNIKNFFCGKGLPRIAVPLSAVICALFIVQANNGTVFDFLFQTHQTHTGIELTEQVRNELLANKLQGAKMPVYFPAYLPKGYSITNIEVSLKKVEIEFQNKMNYILIIQKAFDESGDEFLFDSENTAPREILINGQKAFLKLEDGIHALHFFDNSSCYKVLWTNLSEKEIVRIVESFEIIV